VDSRLSALVEGVRQGGVSQETSRLADFEAFYGRHAALVRRTVFSLSGAQDLDDIVQEAFVKLWRGLAGFRGDSAPRTWVYRVAVNAAREHWRGQGRRRQAMQRYADEPRRQAAPGGQESWEKEQAVAQALGALSDEHREAVTLCYLEGLSLAEAAEAVDVPEGTLKSRLHHARLRLAQALGGEAS
jgi:RNA polymerase sigma-70 factor (ECF subfamily)